MLLGPSLVGSAGGVVSQVAGEATTYMYSSTYMVMGALVGLLIAMFGATILWGTRLSLANKGWIGWLCFMAGMAVLIGMTATPTSYVKLTPRQIEIRFASAERILKVADIVRIETHRLKLVRHAYQSNYKFFLHDGSVQEFSGPLVGAAVEELENNPKFGFSAQKQVAQAAPASPPAPTVLTPRTTAPAAQATSDATSTAPPRAEPAPSPDLATETPSSVIARDPVPLPTPEEPVPNRSVELSQAVERLKSQLIAIRPEGRSQLVAARCAQWLNRAVPITRSLNAISDEKPGDSLSRARLDAALDALANLTESLVEQAMAMPAANGGVSLMLLPESTRQRVLETNDDILAYERGRMGDLTSEELKAASLPEKLDRCVLPSWFLEGRAPGPDELKDGMPPLATPDAQALKHIVKYRDRARFALSLGDTRTGAAYLRADLVTSDDRSIIDGVLWSPALKRPMMLLQWGFGVEARNLPGAGPANLRPPGGLPPLARRNLETDRKLAEELIVLTGEIGLWLAQGLQIRVDSGSFGDWGQESRRARLEHRGIVLLETAPVETLLAMAKAEHLDVLMAFVLTLNRNISSSQPTTSAVIAIVRCRHGREVMGIETGLEQPTRHGASSGIRSQRRICRHGA